MSYTLVLEWMPGDLYMSAVTARCTAPTSSYSIVWLPPNKVYQITLYCGSTSLVSFLVGAFRGKAWSYMENRFIRAEEVADELGVSKPYAYKLIRQLNEELKDKGFITIAGRVNRQYFNERLYGARKEGN